MKLHTVVNLLLLVNWWAGSSLADEYHYTNQILGDRNLGLGGAAVAVATDPTALYYNPAGLAFSKGVNVSGSMTSYAIQNINFEDVLADQDFEVKSDGVVATYIGFESRFQWFPSWKFGFGIFVPDSFRQSQKIIFSEAPDLQITEGYWQRKQDSEESLYSFGAGRRLSSNMGIGWSLGYFQKQSDDMLHSEFQYLPSAGLPGAFRRLTADYKAKTNVLGLQYNLGLSRTVGRHRLGARLQAATILTQTRRGQNRRTLLYLDENGQPLPDPPDVGVNVFQFDNFVIDDDRAFGEPPVLARIGYAYFARWGLLASDLEYIHSRYDRFLRTRVGYVLNYNLGVEVNLAQQFRLRTGVFSNNDSRPELSNNAQLAPSEEKIHIDFQGYTFGLGYYSEGSHYSLGAVYQRGIGKAAIVNRNVTTGNTQEAAIDRVVATSLQVALGVSSSL